MQCASDDMCKCFQMHTIRPFGQCRRRLAQHKTDATILQPLHMRSYRATQILMPRETRRD